MDIKINIINAQRVCELMFVASLLHTLDYIFANGIVRLLLSSQRISGITFRAFCQTASQLV